MMNNVKKQMLIIAIVLIMALISTVHAKKGEIHGTTGVTFDSMYVWRGITVFGSQPGFHPFIDLDLMGTGFGLSVTGHIPMGSGNAQAPSPWNINELQRWDYTLYYKGMMNPEERLETRYKLGWTYFNYPGNSARDSFKSIMLTNGKVTGGSYGSFDLQELFLGLAFPNLLEVPGLVPGYVIVKGWPSNSGTMVGTANMNGGTYSGWAHILMLDYGLKMNCPINDEERIIKLHGEIVYNDAIEPRPGGPWKGRDWTHFMLSASTDFNLTENMVLTPAIQYQHTLEDSYTSGINSDGNILWGSLTIAYKF